MHKTNSYPPHWPQCCTKAVVVGFGVVVVALGIDTVSVGVGATLVTGGGGGGMPRAPIANSETERTSVAGRRIVGNPV